MNNTFQLEENQEYLYLLYKAKNTIWYFNKLIKEGYVGYSSIKFKNKDEIFVWLEDVRIEDGYYCGVLAENSDPEKVPDSEAVDWLIIENQRMLGGYTVRHYRNMLGEEERLNFEIDCGFRIDDGADFFRPDLSTAEGAIITIEEFYNNKDLDGIFSCKDFRKEAENIMIDHSVMVNEKNLLTITSVLKRSFVDDLEISGFPNFEGIERVFTLKDQREDQQLIEEKVIYRDGSITINELWVWNSGPAGWKVLNLVE
ncbi:DUF2314 domain-containing protein [Chryseobacterium kwangjuense]|uniref:DUF2314 domain-containing protein n=1 Tax=Chryseobacterium kwangjuense TaxID=267125 RepID=A0A135WJ25_9FLAO|nr:DUF2314 domain-containing protein [Chryseobacterium kwangjuense]KXH84901.1 hypothetical protein AU378_03860 [Chryseobacterium kwangjuense]